MAVHSPVTLWATHSCSKRRNAYNMTLMPLCSTLAHCPALLSFQEATACIACNTQHTPLCLHLAQFQVFAVSASVVQPGCTTETETVRDLDLQRTPTYPHASSGWIGRWKRSTAADRQTLLLLVLWLPARTHHCTRGQGSEAQSHTEGGRTREQRFFQDAQRAVLTDQARNRQPPTNGATNQPTKFHLT